MPAQYAPKLEFVFTIKLSLDRRFWIRPTDIGATRAGIYLKEGTFEGPNIRGIVVPGSGADWPLVRPNGVIDFDARYMLQEDDGTLIMLYNKGYLWGRKPDTMQRLREMAFAGGPAVDSAEYYLRAAPSFEVETGRHDWLMRHVFVGVGERRPDGNCIRYYSVL